MPITWTSKSWYMHRRAIRGSDCDGEPKPRGKRSANVDGWVQIGNRFQEAGRLGMDGAPEFHLDVGDVKLLENIQTAIRRDGRPRQRTSQGKTNPQNDGADGSLIDPEANNVDGRPEKLLGVQELAQIGTQILQDVVDFVAKDVAELLRGRSASGLVGIFHGVVPMRYTSRGKESRPQ
ncbi:hypothetical protein C0992_008319 [Termitomyces sp. T32_za158]|nr:hypothetical protein C0992_008319 [Termitomyces sp. T32_za158]